MLKTEEKTIDGKRFSVTQLPSKASRQALLRVSKILAPALQEGLGGIKTGKGETEIEMSAVGKGIATLIANLGEDDLEYLIQKFAPTTQFSLPNGNMVPLHRSGMSHENELNENLAFEDVGTLFKWIYFVLEVNYSGFLKGAGDLMDLGGLHQGQASGSQSTLTGTHTGSPSASATGQA